MVKEDLKFAEKKIDLAKKAFDAGDSEKGVKLLGDAKRHFYKKGFKERAAKMYEKFEQFTLAEEIWKELGKHKRGETLKKKKIEGIKEIKRGRSEEAFVRRTSLILGILSLSLSLYLLAKSITGNVINEGTIFSYSFLGVGLFILTLILFLIYVNSKKKGIFYLKKKCIEKHIKYLEN